MNNYMASYDDACDQEVTTQLVWDLEDAWRRRNESERCEMRARSVAGALADRGTHAFELLVTALRTTGYHARPAIPPILAAMDDDRTVEVLVEFTSDRDPAVAAQVAVALEGFGSASNWGLRRMVWVAPGLWL